MRCEPNINTLTLWDLNAKWANVSTTYDGQHHVVAVIFVNSL